MAAPTVTSLFISVLNYGLFQNKKSFMGSLGTCQAFPEKHKSPGGQSGRAHGEDEQDTHGGANKEHSCQPSLLFYLSVITNGKIYPNPCLREDCGQ